MRKIIALLLLTCTLCEGVEVAVKSNNAFALDLYHLLAKEEGNLFFSPISLSSALSIAYMGSRDETQKQMGEALYFDADSDLNGRAYGALTQHLTCQTLDLCNSLFIQRGFPIQSQFLNQTAHHFIAGIHYVDYQKECEKARQEINYYVESGTRGNIKNLLEDSLSSDTRAVIINTIYMKAPWQKQFDEKNTYLQTFYLDDGSQAEIPMMHIQGNYLMGKRKNCTLLEIPYAEDNVDLAFSIVLPDEGVSLSDVDDFLSVKMRSVSTSLTLPKFTMETTLRAKEKLEELGMLLPFSSMADFSGIANDLYISDVIQKAKVIISEEGTEAAAATGIIMNIKCVQEEFNFTADRPFIFFITEKKTGTLLFMGRFVTPHA